MKRFNVRLDVVLTEIGSAEPAEKPPSITDGMPKDSPIRDVAQMFERLQERGIFPGGGTVATSAMMFPGSHGAGDDMSMHHNFEMIVRDFEEQQTILAKFRKIAESLAMPIGDSPAGFDLPLARPESPDLPLPPAES